MDKLMLVLLIVASTLVVFILWFSVDFYLYRKRKHRSKYMKAYAWYKVPQRITKVMSGNSLYSINTSPHDIASRNMQQFNYDDKVSYPKRDLHVTDSGKSTTESKDDSDMKPSELSETLSDIRSNDDTDMKTIINISVSDNLVYYKEQRDDTDQQVLENGTHKTDGGILSHHMWSQTFYPYI